MTVNRILLSVALASSATFSGKSADAVVFSYTNADGEYVVSQKPPKNKDQQYAVLSDSGEFIRLVPGRRQQIPITHWRPWYLPKEPHEFDADPNIIQEREPVVTVDEEGSAQ